MMKVLIIILCNQLTLWSVTDAGGLGFSNIRVMTLYSDIQVLHVLEYINRVQL